MVASAADAVKTEASLRLLTGAGRAVAVPTHKAITSVKKSLGIHTFLEKRVFYGIH
jgi:hypothetical protein